MSSLSVDGRPLNIQDMPFRPLEGTTDVATRPPQRCNPLPTVSEPCFVQPLLHPRDSRPSHGPVNHVAKRKISVVHGPLVPPPPNATLHGVAPSRMNLSGKAEQLPSITNATQGLEAFTRRIGTGSSSVICSTEAKDGERHDEQDRLSFVETILGSQSTDINMPSSIYGTQVASVERKLQGLVLGGAAAARESVVVNVQERTLPPQDDSAKVCEAPVKNEPGEVLQKPKITSPQILEQHISKIISQNAAIVETLDPLWAKRYMRHSSGTGFPCSESNSRQNGALRSRKFSMDPSCLSRSKLQSALMGAAKDRRKTSEGHLGVDLARTTPGRHPGPAVASSSKEVLTRCNVPTVVITTDDSDAQSSSDDMASQNPEGSIIKDLLLKRRSSKFYQGVVSGGEGSDHHFAEEPMHTCPRCKISFRSRDTLDVHCQHYCKGEVPLACPPPWSPEDVSPRKLLPTPASNPPPKKRKISEPVLSLSKDPPLVPKRAADDMLTDTARFVSRASVLRCSETARPLEVHVRPQTERVEQKSTASSTTTSLQMIPSYVCAPATSSDALRRPNTLALQPASLVGSTLVSPETPRPKKQCLQLYINGHAYTYLGLKCSTRSTYCCIYRPQPMYVPQDANPKLSMYSNWRVVPAPPPVPGVKPETLLSLYDSRQWLHEGKQHNAVSTCSSASLVTHSSYWLYRSRDKTASSSESSESSESDSSRKQSTVSEPETDVSTMSPRSSAVEGTAVSEENTANIIHTRDDSASGLHQDSQDEDDCSGEAPKRVKIFEGGFKSNEDYTYVRGRGRGKYVCEECGIRCKKPSMLKKHIRTHTDLRPYSCRHCSFAFKTKGNLTKHMKSKAHHKKCVELGIVPVPTTIDDSQIDAETLAKQEQQRRDHPCSDEDDDDDEDIDDEDSDGVDEDYDVENDGVPIPSPVPQLPVSCTLTSVITAVGTAKDIVPIMVTAENAMVVTAVASPQPQTSMEDEQEAARSLLHLSNFAATESGWHPQLAPPVIQTAAPTAPTISETVAPLPQHQVPISFSQPDTLPRAPESPPMWPHHDDTSNSSGSLSPWAHMGGRRPRSFSVDMSQEQRHLIQQTAGSPNEEPGEYVTRRYSMSSLCESRHFPRSMLHGQLQDGPMDLSTARQRRVEILPGGIVSGRNVMSYARNPPSLDNKKEPESLLGACLQYGSATTYCRSQNDAPAAEAGDGGAEHRSSSPEALWANDLLRSAEMSHGEGKCTCGICHKTFPKASQLRMHVNIHYFERPFRCDNCAVSFRTKGHLQKHRRSVSHYNRVNMNLTFGTATAENPRPFKCADCKIAFRIHGHLAKHLRSKMHILKLECLGKLPFGMYAEMERSGISLNEIDTSDCDNSLESLQVMAQKLYHQSPEARLSTNGEDAPCQRPGDMTPLLTCVPANTVTEAPPASVLRTELGTHTIIAPSEAWEAPPGARTCPLCSRLLKSAKSLQVHLHCEHGGGSLTSSPEPVASWTCSICNRRFPSDSLLQQHFVSHTQPRPYVCDRCDAGFTSALLLTNHMATHDQQQSTLSHPFTEEHSLHTGQALPTV
ncbi:uncharacterized protein LOC135400263 [Ornithodoros turicata]|uniref:uncharacterized protein LOC135400263 n=1 Tax=Ornithodoros turicata TaxID=34597 RepID=UPI00313A07FD